MLSAMSGPFAVWGQGAPLAPGQPPSGDYNPDAGPSSIAVGTIFPDQRFPVNLGVAPGSPAYVGLWNTGRLMAIDQAPSLIATANIAALANAVSGTPMVLVTSTGAGITVTTSVTTILQTGKVVPSGALAIDLLPALITFGQNATMQVVDPRQNIARAVSITGATSSTGGHFIVAGYDLYGNPQTENINAGAATLTNGAKGWKFITSVTPQFSDAHNYSIGTADIFEFPVAIYEFAAANIVWNNAVITANTGFVAAVTTTPSAITGSVRGTYAVQSASDGTKKLQVWANIMPWNAASLYGTASVYGQVPA